METKNLKLIVASRPKEHVHIKYEPNQTRIFHFPNLLMGKFDILKIVETRWKLAETKNFHLLVVSRPNDHVYVKY